MTLPHPDTFLLHRVFRYLAGNNLSGHYLQFGMNGGFYLSYAWKLAHSWEVDRMREQETGVVTKGFPDMRFYAWDTEKDPEAQNVALCTGMPPERLTVTPGPFSSTFRGPQRVPAASAAVVVVDLPNREDVRDALIFASLFMRENTVVVMNKWWQSSQQTERGFFDWSRQITIVGDHDDLVTQFQDNGWARAFIVSKRIEQWHFLQKSKNS